MKKITMILCLLLAGLLTKAVPVSGSFTIPGTTYATIAAAFTDLNTNGVDGPCEFLIDAGYSETGLNLILNVPTASASFPITFKKNPAQTGANPKIIVSAGTAATTDGAIILAGTDYVTFEYLDIDASAQTTIEWGYALVKRQNSAPFDGCQHITISGCAITLNRTNTKAIGIYSGNHIATATTSLTITSATDACNDCVFVNNTISNVYIGISLNGFASTAPYALYDHNNEIGQSGSGKNRIYNFGGANTAAYGIYATNQDQIKVINDSIANSAGSTNRLAGILLQTGVSSSAEVAFNYISVASVTTTSQSTYGIWNLLGGTAAGNTISFHDNIIKDCSSTTATASGPLYGILNSAAAENVLIYKNTFSGFTLGTTGAQSVIRSEASAINVSIYNNQILNISNTGTGGLTLIHNQGSTTANIYLNELHNCNANGGTVYGIYSALGTNVNIYRNNLYGISSNNGSTASSLVYGIYNTSTPNCTVYNNFISDLQAPLATNNPAICGLYLTGGSANNVFFNTVFLNAASTGTTFGTAAMYAGSVPTTTLKNNLFINTSTPGASGYTVAYRRSTSTLSTYSSLSNNNDFYAGTPGPNNLVYYDGTTPYQTLADFQAVVTPADAVSFTEMPPFINSSAVPYDLHIQTGVATLCESGGSVVSSPAIIDDFDGNARFPETGYPENASQPATAPDAGADEFAGGLGITTKNLTLNIDMSTAAGFTPGVDVVYVAGGFTGAFWNEPGTNPSLALTQVGSTLNYTITLAVDPGTYEYKYFRNSGWDGGEWVGGPNRNVNVAANMTVNDTWSGSINWANVQWPGTGTITVGSGYDVYAQAYIGNGISAAGGATYGLQAWIGYSTSNTDPSTWTNWIPAPFSGQAYDNDEFKADLGSVITSTGTYYYASRFQFGNGSYLYGGFNGGFWDGTSNVSGVLTVNESIKTLNMKLFLQGLYAGAGTMNKAQGTSGDQFPGTTADKVSIELHAAADGALVYTLSDLDLSTTGDVSGNVPAIHNGSYYIYVKHRNSIVTSTAAPISFAGGSISYDYSTGLSQAFGSNMKDMAGVSVLFCGDENQDGAIDSTDMNACDNDGSAFLAGYNATDINGDGVVDSSDMIIIDNNNSQFVGVSLPF
ncbi:MAG: hypothetical protein IPH88_18075 [Bacteroidales bacterium]|nr:hypothetical protein [Bacteroidales bacterium]